MGQQHHRSGPEMCDFTLEQLETRTLLSATLPSLGAAAGGTTPVLNAPNLGSIPEVGATKIVTINSRLDVVIRYLGQVAGIGGVMDEYQINLSARNVADKIGAVDIQFVGQAYQVGSNTTTLAAAEGLPDVDLDSHLLIDPDHTVSFTTPMENNNGCYGLNADGFSEGVGTMTAIVAIIGAYQVQDLSLAHIVVPQGMSVTLTGDVASGAGTLFHVAAPGAAGISIDVDQDAAHPIVTTTAGPMIYAGNLPLAVDSGLVVTDTDSLTLTGATVRIAESYVTGQDSLGFVNQSGITGAWNAATGALTLSGTASLASYQAALRSVTYANTSSSPTTGQRLVSFTVSDGVLDSEVAWRSVSVLTSNVLPTLSNITKSANKNSTIKFSLSDFAAGWKDANAGDSLQKIKITTLPASGALKLNGVAVKVNQEIAASQLSKLIYTPATGYVGNVSFGWNGSDGKGYAKSSARFSITIANRAPTVSNIYKSTARNRNVKFAAADFAKAWADPDAGDSLRKIKITSLPAKGTLKLNGVKVKANQEIAASQLSKLTFTPAGGQTGNVTFGWNGSDGMTYAASRATVTIKVG